MAADAFLLPPSSIPKVDFEAIGESIRTGVADLTSSFSGDKKHQVLRVDCNECLEPGKTASLIYDFKISNLKGEIPHILINGADLTPGDIAEGFNWPPRPKTISIPLVDSDYNLEKLVQDDVQATEADINYHWSYTWKFGAPQYNQPAVIDSGNVIIKIQPNAINGVFISDEQTPRVAVEIVTDSKGDMSIANVGLWEELHQKGAAWGEMTYEPVVEGECTTALCRLMEEFSGWGSVASDKVTGWGQKVGDKIKGCHGKLASAFSGSSGEEVPESQTWDQDWDQDWDEGLEYDFEGLPDFDYDYDYDEPSLIAVALAWIIVAAVASIIGYGMGCLAGVLLSPIFIASIFILRKITGCSNVTKHDEEADADESGKGLLANQEAPPAYEDGIEVVSEKQ